MKFPHFPAQTQPVILFSGEGSHAHSLRVMHVDDDVQFRKDMKEYLERRNLEVFASASSVDEALQTFDQLTTKPDVVILDGHLTPITVNKKKAEGDIIAEALVSRGYPKERIVMLSSAPEFLSVAFTRINKIDVRNLVTFLKTLLPKKPAA